MKDSTELHTCGLEMKGGLNGINYPQSFVRAPKSLFHSEPPAHPGKETPNNRAMKMSLGC